MFDSPEDQDKVLKQFRNDVVSVLADIMVRLTALEEALQDGVSISQSELEELRNSAKKQRSHFLEHFYRKISLLHESR
ncbi:MAG TPA: hypothetical protein VMX16_07875 [Terriglobia bacterium]|nr:hypothetical protein [Terriglobia bacterium]